MIETLVRINVPSTENYQFMPYGEGVYKSTLTKVDDWPSYWQEWNQGTYNERRIIVGGVIVNNSAYSKQTSLAACVADDASFYWDNANQTLYIHFEFDKIPETSIFIVGVQGGYSRYGLEESIYVDDILYEPRLKTVPNIKKSVDKFQVGKMKFNDQTITLYNGDGALDTFIQNPVPGAEASVVLYDTDTDTELTYYTGFVTSDTSTYDEYTIKITDKRRRENIKIPSTLFDDTTYPNIESKYTDKVIPEGYGDVTRVKAFPVNGEASSGNVQYKYATDATTLTTVEVEEDGIWSTVTALNSNPSTGYFELARADATNASGGLLPCVVTARLRDYDEAGDIIKDMAERYNSIAYDSTNYDTTEWVSESAKLCDSMALYMEKGQEFFKWIEALQNGDDHWFVYDIDGSGKRTLRVSDPNRATVRAIRYDEIKGDLKKVSRDFTEYSSTVAVLYNEDVEAESFDRVDITTYEESVLEKYQLSQDSEFEALMTAAADATRKANLIAEDQSEVREVIEVPIHETTLSALSLKLYDIVTVETSRPVETAWHEQEDSITSLSTAADSITSLHTASDSITSYVGSEDPIPGSPPAREYWGTIRGQIIGIGYNPSDLTYTLTIRERPESEVA